MQFECREKWKNFPMSRFSAWHATCYLEGGMTAKKSRTTASSQKRDIETLLKIEERIQRERTAGQRMAWWASEYAGTMEFVLLHVAWYVVWILLNSGLIRGIRPFDPFPFQLLTMVVSLEAIFLTLFVLIAQNRLTKESDRRALLDLEINLLAERESTETLALLKKIGAHLGLEDDEKPAATRTNVAKLARALERKS
jgi:uncharacterized membrane protein